MADSAAPLLALVVFALTTSITPGPNNVMVTASGANYGYRRTVPHMAGIVLGFVVMLGLVALGLGAVLQTSPALAGWVRWAGAAYLVWLGLRIALAGGRPAAGDGRARPLSLLEAALFQWVNPKAWGMALGAMATFTAPATFPLDVALIALVFAIVAYPCLSLWTMAGIAIRRVLTGERALRVFNGAMGALVIASVATMLL